MAGPGPEIASVEDREIAGVPVRIYRPSAADGLPVLLYFHGGGWVIGDLDSHDGVSRDLASQAGILVIAVDYRLAPEHKFPAAVDDSLAVTQWVLDHAAEVGGDPSRVAVGGDSAGGNLAAILAHELRGRLAFQLLVYPATDMTMSFPSITDNGEGYLLTKASMDWFTGHYLDGTGADRRELRLSPLNNTDWTGLPPALVITAEFDPLRDEGEAYAAKLQAAGVPTTLHRYDGQMHVLLHAGRADPGRQGSRSRGCRCAQAGAGLSPASVAARTNTASSIGSVSLPVKVFCWLGWNEHSSVGPCGAGRRLDAVAEPRRGRTPSNGAITS